MMLDLAHGRCQSPEAFIRLDSAFSPLMRTEANNLTTLQPSYWIGPRSYIGLPRVGLIIPLRTSRYA